MMSSVTPMASRAVADKPGIAVLTFDSLGEDAATARLATGLTEDIITDLAASAVSM